MKQFIMAVGMVLYLVKHTRADISNSVREISKVSDGSTEAHLKVVLRTVNYVRDREHLSLLLQLKLNNEGFYLEGISDSEYAGDPDKRISVYGNVLYFSGPNIAWKAKAGKTVTKSSRESEYYAPSEITKDIMFAKNFNGGNLNPNSTSVVTIMEPSK
jgi:hypothetical protein